MINFTAELANLVGWGPLRTDLPGGGWRFDRFEINVPKHKIEIVQRESALRSRSDLRGTLIATSRVTVTNVAQYGEGESIVTDLSFLLSFAQSSLIVPFNFRFQGEGHSYSTSGFVGAWRPPFDCSLNAELTNFVQRAWEPFRRLKDTRSLPSLIHLIAHADNGNLIELKLLQVIVCLENVKAYWALSEGGKYGIQENSQGEFVQGGRRVGFERLLFHALRDAGMQGPNHAKWSRIKKVRNAIIHRGVIPPTSKSAQDVFGAGTSPDAVYGKMLEVIEDCHDVLREFLLRLLAYKGPFHPYSVPSGRGRPSQM